MVRSHLQAHSIRFRFHPSVLHHRDPRSERVLHPPGPLLHDMRQFMPQKLLTLCGVWVVLTRYEIQIRTVREGQRADRRRLGANMDANIREAGVEERFHFLPHGIGQWLTARGAEVQQIRRQLKRLAIANSLHDRSLGSGTTGLQRLRFHSSLLRQDRLGNLRADRGRGLQGARL